MRALTAARCRVCVSLLLASACLLLHGGGLAQTRSRVALQPIDVPHWLNDRSLLGLNMVLGGVSAGIVSELRGGSFLQAFPAGASGGALVFLGKNVAGRQWTGAGLVGRQLGALGGGVVQNAAAGRSALELIEVRAGPLGVALNTATHRMSARLDPVGAGVLVVGLLHPDFSLDARASATAGMPVFRARRGRVYAPWTGEETSGLNVASVLFLADLPELGAMTQRAVFAHERVHVLQADALQAYFGRPVLDALLPSSGRWRRARPYLDVNLGQGLAEVLDAALFRAYASRPGEVEAEAFARTR